MMSYKSRSPCPLTCSTSVSQKTKLRLQYTQVKTVKTPGSMTQSTLCQQSGLVEVWRWCGEHSPMLSTSSESNNVTDLILWSMVQLHNAYRQIESWYIVSRWIVTPLIVTACCAMATYHKATVMIRSSAFFGGVSIQWNTCEMRYSRRLGVYL